MLTSAAYVQPKPKTMTVQYFRLLLIVSVIIGVIGGGIDLVFPELLTEVFHEAQAEYAQYETFSTWFLLFITAAVVTAIVSFYGLYRLRPWAPRFSLVSTLLGLLFVVCSGPSAQSGIAVAACYLSSYMWGALIVLAFSAPFNAHFQRGNGSSSLHVDA
jgi:Na+-driven multidrug efflux pump